MKNILLIKIIFLLVLLTSCATIKEKSEAIAEKENEKSVHTSAWPEFKHELVNEETELTGDLGVDIINAVRKYKSEKQMSLKEELNELILVSSEDNFKEMISSIENDLKAVLKVKEIKFSGETSLETEKFKVSVGIS